MRKGRTGSGRGGGTSALRGSGRRRGGARQERAQSRTGALEQPVEVLVRVSLAEQMRRFSAGHRLLAGSAVDYGQVVAKGDENEAMHDCRSYSVSAAAPPAARGAGSARSACDEVETFGPLPLRPAGQRLP